MDSIIELIEKKSGISFSRYAYSSLERRIDRLVTLYYNNDIKKFEHQLSTIDNPANLHQLVDDLTVNTTEFFRDWEAWKIISRQVLPALSGYGTIRIWHAGCSTGEEVISMGILCAEAGITHKVKQMATDVSRQALEFAQEGKYRFKTIEQSRENIAATCGADAFRNYFHIEDGFYTVKTALLPQVTYKRTDLSNLRPFSKFDIILCRNVMIYFNADLQNELIGSFADSLFKNGFLVIGKKENISLFPSYTRFNAFSQPEKIYQLKESETGK